MPLTGWHESEGGPVAANVLRSSHLWGVEWVPALYAQQVFGLFPTNTAVLDAVYGSDKDATT